MGWLGLCTIDDIASYNLIIDALESFHKNCKSSIVPFYNRHPVLFIFELALSYLLKEFYCTHIHDLLDLVWLKSISSSPSLINHIFHLGSLLMWLGSSPKICVVLLQDWGWDLRDGFGIQQYYLSICTFILLECGTLFLHFLVQLPLSLDCNIYSPFLTNVFVSPS